MDYINEFELQVNNILENGNKSKNKYQDVDVLNIPEKAKIILKDLDENHNYSFAMNAYLRNKKNFSRNAIFYRGNKIEVLYRLRKKSVIDPEAVYVSFPYQIENGKIFLDVPGGNIEAGVDQIKGSSNDWYTVQNFATARNSHSQVVMCSQEIPLMQFGAINTGRYQQ